jgi:hypothetical protein
MAKWLVIPKGTEVERLRINTGLDQYTLLKKPKLSRVAWNKLEIDVYMFKLKDIVEESVIKHMVAEKARDWAVDEKQALDRLTRILCAIPYDQVEIVEVQE